MDANDQPDKLTRISPVEERAINKATGTLGFF
jgi:hypothetical protein